MSGLFRNEIFSEKDNVREELGQNLCHWNILEKWRPL